MRTVATTFRPSAANRSTPLAVTGSVISALDVIMSVATVPDKAEIGLLCEKAEPHLQLALGHPATG
ncbi:hypothetical protein ACNPQM_33855 [Streptomyces sp. NPDC056231]|uniref:hypothetical protein n=1 Tax=Streptomyces sp. NPDC056231 TaxID=3345755 RepID=UPI003AAAFFBF